MSELSVAERRSSTRLFVAVAAGLALAVAGAVASGAVRFGDASTSPATLAASSAPAATAMPTPDPAAMYELMVSEHEYCQICKP